MVSFANLPGHLLPSITSHLDGPSFATALLINKEWYEYNQVTFRCKVRKTFFAYLEDLLEAYNSLSLFVIHVDDLHAQHQQEENGIIIIVDGHHMPPITRIAGQHLKYKHIQYKTASLPLLISLLQSEIDVSVKSYGIKVTNAFMMQRCLTRINKITHIDIKRNVYFEEAMTCYKVLKNLEIMRWIDQFRVFNKKKDNYTRFFNHTTNYYVELMQERLYNIKNAVCDPDWCYKSKYTIDNWSSDLFPPITTENLPGILSDLDKISADLQLKTQHYKEDNSYNSLNDVITKHIDVLCAL